MRERLRDNFLFLLSHSLSFFLFSFFSSFSHTHTQGRKYRKASAMWRPGGDEDGESGGRGDEAADDDINWNEETKSEYDPEALRLALEKSSSSLLLPSLLSSLSLSYRSFFLFSTSFPYFLFISSFVSILGRGSMRRISLMSIP
jgi:hypothetical protein